MQFNVREAIQHSNEHCDRIIATLGEWVKPDDNGYLSLLQQSSKSVMVNDGDGWGDVSVIFPAEGHLILCVNFGDDGYKMFSPTIVDQSAQLITGIPEAIRAMLDIYDCVNDDSFTVNKLSEYTVSELFGC